MESQTVEQLTNDISNSSPESVNTSEAGVASAAIKKKPVSGKNPLESQDSVDKNNAELNDVDQTEEVQDVEEVVLPKTKKLKGCWEDADGNLVCP